MGISSSTPDHTKPPDKTPDHLEPVLSPNNHDNLALRVFDLEKRFVEKLRSAACTPVESIKGIKAALSDTQSETSRPLSPRRAVCALRSIFFPSTETALTAARVRRLIVGRAPAVISSGAYGTTVLMNGDAVRLSDGTSAVVAKLFLPDTDGLLGEDDTLASDAVHEAFIGELLNRLNMRNFMVMYSYVPPKTCGETGTALTRLDAGHQQRPVVSTICAGVATEDPATSAKRKLLAAFSPYFIAVEAINNAVTLEDFLFSKRANPLNVAELFLQISHALMCSSDELAFVHTDLHLENVLVAKTDDGVFVYPNGEEIRCASGLRAVIIDYGHAQVSLSAFDFEQEGVVAPIVAPIFQDIYRGRKLGKFRGIKPPRDWKITEDFSFMLNYASSIFPDFQIMFERILDEAKAAMGEEWAHGMPANSVYARVAIRELTTFLESTPKPSPRTSPRRRRAAPQSAQTARAVDVVAFGKQPPSMALVRSDVEAVTLEVDAILKKSRSRLLLKSLNDSNAFIFNVVDFGWKELPENSAIARARRFLHAARGAIASNMELSHASAALDGEKRNVLINSFMQNVEKIKNSAVDDIAYNISFRAAAMERWALSPRTGLPGELKDFVLQVASDLQIEANDVMGLLRDKTETD